MKERILIVDDDGPLRNLLCESIKGAGYSVRGVDTAEEAIRVLEEEPYDLAVVDIVLPEMNGLQLTHLIRRNFDTDVIVMTGYLEEFSYEEAINHGATDFLFKPLRIREIILRVRRVLRERRVNQERNQMVETLKAMAVRDGLTNLYNARHFHDQVPREVEKAQRYHYPLSLILVDIDNFKRYNDSYGHLKGDEVLIAMGKIIGKSLRKTDQAFRLGGEEFTALLPGTSAEGALVVAQRIRAAAEQEIFFPDVGIRETVTVSVGVTRYESGEAISAFVQRADKAMYLSKQNGKNNVSQLLTTGAP